MSTRAETLRLIALARGPDPHASRDAEAALLRLHGGLLRQVLRRFSVPAGLPPDDLLQEGRLALLRSVRGYDPQKAAFSSYAIQAIWVALKRACDDYGRGRADRLPEGRLAAPPASLSEDEPDHSGGADPYELPAWVLDALTPLESSVLADRLLYGRSWEETAQAAGVTASRAREAYAWALARLRERLAAPICLRIPSLREAA